MVAVRRVLHRRHALVGVAASAALVAALGVPSAGSHVALASSVASMKQEAAALTAEISSLNTKIQALSNQYQQVQAQIRALEAKEATVQAQITAKRKEMATLHAEIVQEAVGLFTQSGSNSELLTLLQNSANSSAVAQEDIQTASSSQEQAVNAYKEAGQELAAEEAQLQSDQSQQQSLLGSLSQEESQAQADQQKVQSELASVNQQIQQMVAQQIAAEQAAREAQLQREQLAAEQAAAAAAAQQAQQAPPPAPAPTPAAVAPSGYANPIRDISDLQIWRVDQGVDYNGYGPIFAIGDGVVLSTFNGGWPGGTFITYRLTNGPAAGLIVYAAEDINVDVSVGQYVTPNTVLGTLYNGPDGIETGWASPLIGETMAMQYGQFYGSNSTAFGYNFSQLLQSLGAPGGVLQNSPTGSLPAGWPQW